MSERIQKIMARAGLGSRRHNEELIRQGRVRLNGRLARLGDQADAESDTIVVDGKELDLDKAKRVYVALHKPKGVISSLEDDLDQGRTTVRDLISLPGHIYPVGRLDKQSEGLMLMTNDGQLAHKLTHPRYGHEKTYEVMLNGRIPNEDVEQWERGVWLHGKKTIPADVRVLERHEEYTRLEVVLREGRKRQIRRIAAQFGYPVQKLVRRKIGPLRLGNLPPGQWRHLEDEEVKALKHAVNESSGRRSRRTKRKK